MREVGQIRKLKKAPAGRVSNRRDRRKLATRQALLDATIDLLSSRSMDALTVDEIAMRADVAKGTLRPFCFFRKHHGHYAVPFGAGSIMHRRSSLASNLGTPVGHGCCG